MRDDDVIRHQQRSEVEYDCWHSIGIRLPRIPYRKD
jgi:hypothetical protein